MRFLSIPNSSSELKDFACWFNQDFDLLGGDANNFAREYFSSLPVKKRQALKSEMKKLLNEFPGKKQKGLINAWFRLGAQWWDRKQDLRASFEAWIEEL
jgi:hypothetical protein